MLANAENDVRPMQYPMLAGASPGSMDCESPANLITRVRELQATLAEREKQFARQMDAVRREGQDKAKELAAGEQEAWRRDRAAELGSALVEFRNQRDEYLARVEHEAVRLALAIAERILHREAQMDPLLLTGAVRVALGQLAETTVVRLHVPAAQAAMWAEMLRLMPGLPLRPEVVGDAEMQEAEAVLEADLGSVDLGVRAQIAEIERGFFDLLDARRETKAQEPQDAAREMQG
ncbi:MAG TPA: FliH/SctL family protein [Acidobacteriaceae bacterium]|jgi:flagellar assembly protein FliH|nr:FliH/SctL family protein [Acidobacteriaceae bacterium]